VSFLPLLDWSVRKTGFPRYSRRLDSAAWYVRFYQTRREFAEVPTFAAREQLYRHLSDTWFDGGREALDFFEFGVFQGASLRNWCDLNTCPSTRFFGFDSFQGLPEDWGGEFRTGAFDVGGILPQIDDLRVRFVSGWFQDSLPLFVSLYEPESRLVVHNDCDLYSSSLFCLVTMNHLMPRGTVVIFDEFNDAFAEYRALVEFCSACMRHFRIIAGTEGLAQAAVEIL
jgi:O-methyltransferase